MPIVPELGVGMLSSGGLICRANTGERAKRFSTTRAVSVRTRLGAFLTSSNGRKPAAIGSDRTAGDGG